MRGHTICFFTEKKKEIILVTPSYLQDHWRITMRTTRALDKREYLVIMRDNFVNSA